MTEPTSPTIAAGWYPDPAGGPRSRWWDGIAWTEHFQEPYTAGEALKAPDGIPVYNVWIWLVTLLPLLGLLSYFTVDWSNYLAVDINDPYSSQASQLAMLTSPAYLLSVLGGWVLYAAIVVCAVLDWRKLKALGVPRPFHWAWGFLSIVYPIGRSVVIRRRTGHGIAPMWVSIGILALSVLFSIGLVIVIFATVFQSVQDQVQY